MNEILAIENLSKSYGRVQALQGVTASMRQGDIVAVLGLNGAGKTTLLETVLGFGLPDTGEVSLFGHKTRVLTDERVKKRIGFVPQQEELLPSMRVDHYLDLIGTFYADWDAGLVKRLCSDWELPVKNRIRNLSVGQRQKVAIISAIGFRPDLLVLDEPVASLDPRARRQFLREVISLTEDKNCAVLFSTHIVSDVERIADRIWMLRSGELEMDTTIDDIKEGVVRIHVKTELVPEQLVSELKVVNVQDNHLDSVLTLSGWSDALEDEWRESTEDNIVVEKLSLEEIFLEMNT